MHYGLGLEKENRKGVHGHTFIIQKCPGRKEQKRHYVLQDEKRKVRTAQWNIVTQRSKSVHPAQHRLEHGEASEERSVCSCHRGGPSAG